MESVNLLVITGTLERLNLRYREDGTAICSGSLRAEEIGNNGTIFKTFIPFEAYGKVAESLGERQAQEVVLFQGKVFWRKYTTKGGEDKSGLALLVQKVSLLVPALAEVGA